MDTLIWRYNNSLDSPYSTHITQHDGTEEHSCSGPFSHVFYSISSATATPCNSTSSIAGPSESWTAPPSTSEVTVVTGQRTASLSTATNPTKWSLRSYFVIQTLPPQQQWGGRGNHTGYTNYTYSSPSGSMCLVSQQPVSHVYSIIFSCCWPAEHTSTIHPQQRSMYRQYKHTFRPQQNRTISRNTRKHNHILP